MLKRRTIIEISPTRLELAVLRGRDALPIRTETLRFDAESSDEQWLDVVSTRLRLWRSKCGVDGSPATVLYTGGEALATLVSSPASLPAPARRSAALLALADRVTFALEGQPADVQVLAQDHDAGGRDDPPQAHLLAVADTDESLSALAAAVQGAGFQPGALIPAAAAEMARAVQLAIEQSRASSGGVHAEAQRQTGSAIMVLRFGEHASVLAAAESGYLRFVRPLAIGAETLVAATAPAVGNGDGASARALLYSVGIPGPADIIDERAGVTGQKLLPLLQPILQRCVVEVKQSIRFGLSKRDDVRLLVDGFGARIPGLAEVLAETVGIPAAADQPAGRTCESPASSDCGPIAALASAPLSIALLPLQLSAARNARRLQAFLGAGAAAAAALIATDGILAHASAARLERQVDLLERQSALHEASYLEQAAYLSRIAATNRALTRLNDALGDAPDWGAALAFIAEATPPHIRIDRIAIADDDSGPSCVLSGRVRLASGAGGAAELQQYVRALSAAPITRAVRLGATGRVELGEGAQSATEQHFELTIELVALPRWHHYQQIVSALEPSP